MYHFTFVILKCSKKNVDCFFFFRINEYRSLLYDFRNKNMDLSQSKRKRKGFKTNLTISKKSRRYRKQFGNDKTTETAFLSSSEEYDTQSDASETGYLVSQCVEKSYFYRENIKTISKSTQFSLRTRQVAIQNVPSTRIKCIQTCVKKYNDLSTQTTEDDNAESLRDKLISTLRKDGVLDKFANVLNQHEQIDKFVKSITSIAEGKLKPTNLAWKSFLDTGTMFSLNTTTTMNYDPEWLEFCQVIHYMFGSGVINALQGRGHFSQVTANKSKKSLYNPVDGEFNFAIPSIPTLKKLDIGYPMEIPVGFVEQSLKIASQKSKEGAQFVLSFDGKLVAPGCKGENCGDTNMWGAEGPPNLRASVKILKNTLSSAKAIDIDVDNTCIHSHYQNIRRVMHNSSMRIKRLRGRITGAFYLRKKLVEKCANNAELQYKHRRRMSSLNQNTAECESIIRRLLEVNLKCSEIMASINNNSDVHICGRARHVSLIEHANNFQLLPPEIVKFTLDLKEENNLQYIKQRTEEWFALRKQSRVTGSTLNSAIGLDTLQKQKQHHYIHIRGREPPPVPDDLQKKFDYGTKNEVNGIATLISTVAPAYLPACFAYYEVGPCFVGTVSHPKLLEVSADGILQCSYGENCPNYSFHKERKIVVEIKSPFPQENIAETLFYEIP